MAWTYKAYEDNDETKQAKKNVNTIASQKPGEFTYDDYKESGKVTDAWNMYEQTLANKPGAFEYDLQDLYDGIMNDILNRGPFTYDINGDVLYQQYKDQYTLQGKQAMMDTMGQAAAMTGGYGNSYAQSVGQQTYQGYLQQLNDKVPELYQLALNRYIQEGEDLYNKYGMLSNDRQTKYGEHRDTVSDWKDDRSFYGNMYNTLSESDWNRYNANRNFDFGVYQEGMDNWQFDYSMANDNYWNNKNFGYGQYTDNRNLSYTQHRDDVADTQYAEQFAYTKGRDAVADSQWEKQYEASLRSSSVGGGGDNKPITTSVSEYNSINDYMKTNFTTEEQAEYYLDGLVSSGAISPEVATSLADSFSRALAAGGIGKNAGKTLGPVGELNRNHGKSYQTKN